VDNPDQRLDDLIIDTTSQPVAERRANLLGGVTTIAVQGRRRSRPEGSWWPYGSAPSVGPPAADFAAVALTAVPYFVWGNRTEGAMRVWTPASG
jgi:DUF1680 family protein